MSVLEWAESQLAEMELLTSMFPSGDEMQVQDQLALAELRDYVEGSGSGSVDSPPSSRPQFLIKQKMDAGTTEKDEVILSCAFPPEYPSVLPEVNVRCSSLSRAQQTRLHSALTSYLSENCQGEVCVLSAVDWVKENLQCFIDKSSAAAQAMKREASHTAPADAFTRLWIYSHHIYNTTKRKNILEWSRELGLSGFSMPGKPGIVCVEGAQEACEEFWSRLKVLTWKRIMVRHREDVAIDGDATVDSLRKFSGFEETMFDPHGNRHNHMDLGLLYQFLNEKGCCDIFQMYFGIEGR